MFFNNSQGMHYRSVFDGSVHKLHRWIHFLSYNNSCWQVNEHHAHLSSRSYNLRIFLERKKEVKRGVITGGFTPETDALNISLWHKHIHYIKAMLSIYRLLSATLCYINVNMLSLTLRRVSQLNLYKCHCYIWSEVCVNLHPHLCLSVCLSVCDTTNL